MTFGTRTYVMIPSTRIVKMSYEQLVAVPAAALLVQYWKLIEDLQETASIKLQKELSELWHWRGER
jgi:hypothetical protein